MRRDHEIQKLVLEQLDADPAVTSSHIGVAVREGVVTLSGHVPSVGERRAAEISTGHVHGVKAVIDELRVELPQSCETDDEVLARLAYARLSSNKLVPLDRIHMSVADGVVTLRGDVAYQFQRQAAEEDLHKLDCVRDIQNEIAIRPPVKAEQVREKIHDALARITPIGADRVTVKAEGGRVTLSGTVTSWHQKGLVENTAWSVPGVVEVVDDITVV